ncbi:MAG: ABC transporter ATP-binding protein [Treponema sp.]|nr:ABC transporter ATP-binding protein [Treponema sp.]MEE3314818.1 ABC transporter ATP-binding protein [Treponema sp.]
MTAFKWFFSFLKKHGGKMCVGLFIIAVVSAMAVINPKVSGFIVDQVIVAGKYEYLWKCVAVLLGVCLFREGFQYLAQMLFERSSQGVLFDMRDAVYRKLLHEDFSFYNNNRTGDLMSRQTGDMDAVRHFVAFVIYNVFRNCIWLLSAVVMIFFVNVKLALMFLAVLPFTAFVVFMQMRAVGPAFAGVRQCFSSLNAYVQEHIAANRVVRAFAKEAFEKNRFEKENEAFRQSEINASKIWQRYVPIFEFLGTVINVILMIYGGYLTITKQMSIGDFVTVNGYLWMLTNPLRMLGWLINDAMRFKASIDKIYKTFSAEPDIKLPSHPVVKQKIEGEVEFKNVSYSTHGEEILHDISFRTEKGKSVGIIGGTGSGKTTIMNLLCRFYDVTDGSVCVDGTDVREMNMYNLRENIGMAMQDVFLFSDTIEGNIAYGNPDCPFEKVEAAAKLADADSFIRAMPEGYDTMVGERGVGLSGGQKQRISLARALLKDPAIIILDDTTSAVDMETETLIQESLKSVAENRTLFVIAYRISSVKDCDQILVMNEGKIIERGTHEELIAAGGYYASVYHHQYGEFSADEEADGGN